MKTTAFQLNHDRQLAAFHESLERERKIVDEMSHNLGTYIEATKDLADLSQEEWNKKENVSKYRQIVRDFNSARQAWNANRLRLGLLLQLEHDDDEYLRSAWEETGTASDAYARCADRWRTKYTNLSTEDALGACKTIRSNLDNVIRNFAKRLVYLRSMASNSMSPKP